MVLMLIVVVSCGMDRNCGQLEELSMQSSTRLTGLTLQEHHPHIRID
jgi:hypothetical protein